jgi:hypothetical protein
LKIVDFRLKIVDLKARYWILDSGYWTLDTRFWILSLVSLFVNPQSEIRNVFPYAPCSLLLAPKCKVVVFFHFVTFPSQYLVRSFHKKILELFEII